MSEKMDNIGIIAGGGQFPMIVADAAKKQGLRVIAVAFEGEADQELENKVDEIVWLKLGQLGKLIKGFKKRNVTKALMAGTINKSRMFGDLKPDIKGIAFLSKFAIFHDDNILRAFANELYKEGIEIISSTVYLPDLLAPEGCLTKRKPGKDEKKDMEIGWKVAKELGQLDIGQCAVVRDKTVLALEAIDGTNATILRGGRIAGEKAVVVKVSKPNQDLRFDIPSVGLETIKAMIEVKAGLLAVETGKTLIFDRDKMIALADENNISIVSCSFQDT